MSHPYKRNLRYLARLSLRSTRQRQPKGRSIVVLILLLLLWSVCLGWGLAQATEPRLADSLAQASALDSTKPAQSDTSATIGAVDVVPTRYQLGQELYLENCATCHIGIPPAIMPSETWRQLLQDSQHYGVQLQPLVDPSLRVVWDYLRHYSRPLRADEETPYRVYQSYYFKALHPRVKLPAQVSLTSCVSCHPGAGAYNFRSLSAEWQNAP